LIQLFIIQGKEKGSSFVFEADDIVVGRSSKNDLQINEGSVSRRHVKIVRRENRYFVEDLNSTNGTYIDRKPIPPGHEVPVEEGIPIAIGGVLLSLGTMYTGETSDIQAWVDFSNDLAETGEISRKDRPINFKESLQLLYRVMDLMRRSSDLNDMLAKSLDCIFEYFKTIDRGLIILIDGKSKKTLDVVSKHRKNSDDTVMMYSRTIVNRVLQENRPLMMSDTSHEEEVRLSESIRLMQIKSIICIPLSTRTEIHGAIYVDSVNKPFGFRNDDFVLLRALSIPLALAVENARLRSLRA